MKHFLALLLLTFTLLVSGCSQGVPHVPTSLFGSEGWPNFSFPWAAKQYIFLRCVSNSAGNECTPRKMTGTAGEAVSAGYAPSGVAFKIVSITAENSSATVRSEVTVGYSDSDCGFEDTACALTNAVPFGGNATLGLFATFPETNHTWPFDPNETVVPSGKYIYLTSQAAPAQVHFLVVGYEE